MKLIIQIPCYNEEQTLPQTLAALPRQLPGIDTIQWLIIDDGSQDRTIEVAQEHGVDHIVRYHKNLGLAKAFMNGLEACIDHGADIIVNTDADNQYDARDIQALVQPILDKRAEIVVGTRPIMQIAHFSLLKKLLQRLGSWTLKRVSNTEVDDAPSGFRAISRKAATQMNVFSSFSYTLETIIQAGQKDIPIVSVPIRVNQDLRPSRLARGIFQYVYNSMATIVRIFMIYRPFRFFALLGSIPFLIGAGISIRYLYFFFFGTTAEKIGKIQSLILASMLISIGFLLFIVALLADLLSVNRRLLEKLNWRIRQIEKTLNESKNEPET